MRPLARLVLAALVLSAAPARAQDPVAFLTETLVAPEILSVDFEPGTLRPWFEAVQDEVRTALAGAAPGQELVVQVLWDRKATARYEVAARPALTGDAHRSLLAALERIGGPAARFTGAGLRLWALAGGGEPAGGETAEHAPALTPWREEREARFASADLAEKYGRFVAWAREEALPILATVAAGVDPKFEGVRAVGASILALDPAAPIDADLLTERNASYWRGLLEMGPGDMLVAAVRPLVLAAEGRLDWSARYARFVSTFAREKTIARAVLDEFAWRYREFDRDLRRRIDEGIACHDRSRFDEAIERYRSVLAAYPHSAMALYEDYFSRAMRRQQDGEPGADPSNPLPEWDAAAPKIYAADPLFHIRARAGSQDEIYEVLLRLATQELHKDPEKIRTDLLREADLALDLGQTGFAAHLYWLLRVHLGDRAYPGRDLLAYFAYSLEPLEVPAIKGYFQEDWTESFAAVAQERRLAREEAMGGKGR